MFYKLILLEEKQWRQISEIFIISLRLIRRAGKETSRSQAEGSTATKIAVSKSEKLNLLGCLKWLLARFKQFDKFL